VTEALTQGKKKTHEEGEDERGKKQNGKEGSRSPSATEEKKIDVGIQGGANGSKSLQEE